MSKPILSADSHVTEPPDTYVDRIDRDYRDRAPHMIHDPKLGDAFVIPGMDRKVPLGTVAAAGQKPEEIRVFGARFEDLHRGGWDPEARMADQDRDGISAEVIYPTVGMLLCNHPDIDYKQACFDAYNLWLAEYCDPHRDRLLGVGQTALRTVEDGIGDLGRIRTLGLRGVMLPGNPALEDYDSPIYDNFWEAAVEIGLPLSFHVLTSRADDLLRYKGRGPKINEFMSIIRSNQDILGMLIFGGVFDRHPKLRIVCVEADAGWAPHFGYRMDHAYERHRHWMRGRELGKPPSAFLAENIYLTFQDDWVAFRMRDLANPRRLLWANDFPHSDSTWPCSQEIIARHTACLSQQEKDWILCDNTAELYGVTLPAA